MPSFPKYLPVPDPAALTWLARRLQELRENASLSIEELAKAADTDASKILSVESGVFHLGLGELRSLICSGYKLSLRDILATFYEAHRAAFMPARHSPDRPFRRDFYYRGRIKSSPADRSRPTPLFTGGDPDRYVWGIPLRELVGQLIVSEFLELAPLKKREPGGTTDPSTHNGEEIIHVIYGNVQVSIEDFQPSMSPGEHIHFLSDRLHYVKNIGPTPALLLIIRAPDRSGGNRL